VFIDTSRYSHLLSAHPQILGHRDVKKNLLKLSMFTFPFYKILSSWFRAHRPVVLHKDVLDHHELMMKPNQLNDEKPFPKGDDYVHDVMRIRI
jgi:hypothetical protein